MKLLIVLLLVGMEHYIVTVQTLERSPKFFGDWLGGLIPRCTGCPPRKCVHDIAVIKGYCCGCSRVSDFLPIDCPSHPNCPVDGRKLCRDYDYMLDCCCP